MTAYFIVSSPVRKRWYPTYNEQEAYEIAQREADKTKTPWTVEYVSNEGRREFVREFRPRPKQSALQQRINARMSELIQSGLSAEEAATALRIENGIISDPNFNTIARVQ